jgi:D-amino-acid dehydrogenase
MKITVIGAGIIGLSTAYYLQKDGHEVTVLEKGDLSDNCSFGNMGYLSPSHIAPLASPGIMAQGFLWMFDRKSPFYVRPELSRDLIDWGLKFWSNCTQANVDKGMKPMGELLLFSKSLFEEWSNSGEMQFELENKGCIMWYQTEKKRKGELEVAKSSEQLGMITEILDGEQAMAMEPHVRPKVLGGVWYKDDAHLYPNALMQQLPKVLEKNGVKIHINTTVTGFERQNGQINAVLADDMHYECDMVVLAAGSWSPLIAKLTGEYLPLMPGKGYSMTVDNPTKQLNYPCIFLEPKVALTPWKNRLRIGSTMDIGAINDEILFPRVQGILEAVPKFMPGYLEDPVFNELADLTKLKANLREKVWFGFRPVSPDGLPYIGFAKNHKNLMMATGHAMLGLSMGAGTGKLIAEMVGGRKTSIDVAAFRVDRFG